MSDYADWRIRISSFEGYGPDQGLKWWTSKNAFADVTMKILHASSCCSPNDFRILLSLDPIEGFKINVSLDVPLL